MSELDLLSIGDANLDAFIIPSESESYCDLREQECFICFTYGDKIPVKSLEYSVGGNAANNAVGAARLGVKVAMVTTLGDDRIGKNIVETLEKEKVDTTFVIQQPAVSSNYNTVINYAGERTIFSYKPPRSYEYPVQFPVTPWLYLTSMGDTFRPFYNHLVAWVRAHPEVKLAFNPGSRQLRAGLEAIGDILKLSHIVYINRKEAEMLTGLKDTLDHEKDLLQTTCGLGPKMAIITDGANGSFVYDGERFIRAGVLPVDAYERTGAGDAFGSGCLAALIKGKSFAEALLWGTVNSASVIGYVGSQRGLLKESEIGEWLDRAKSCQVEVGEF